jgi:hypothetical protein
MDSFAVRTKVSTEPGQLQFANDGDTMLAALLIATTLGLASPTCVDTFHDLYNSSSKLADSGAYAKAAALREAAANIFQDCLSDGKAPRDGMYPFDGVGAYLIAATFWHLAAASSEAERNLALAKASLNKVNRMYPGASLTDAERVYLVEMERIIREDETGKWAVWKDEHEQ